MSNEAKAVCTSQLSAFFAQVTAPQLPQQPGTWHSSFGQQQLTLVNEIRYTISPSSRNTIIQGAIIHKKKRLPTKVGQAAHDRPALCYGLFVRIPSRV